jgi:hypothetical protein
MKGIFYEELEHISHKFTKYHTKFLLGNSMPKQLGKTYLNLELGNDSLSEINNDN